MAIDWTISRRTLISGAVTALAGTALSVRAARPTAGERGGVELVSAARMDGIDGGAIVSEGGLARLALPGRAHALTRLIDGRIVLMGRRPGRFGAVIDPVSADEGAAPHLFAPVKGHRFAGHAAASPDGALLATSEIDAETGAGAVALRDAKTALPKTVIPAGIEPHDLVFANGGARLVVAVGGIAHAADVKGPALNLGNIESAILEIDPKSGAVLKRHALPHDMKSLSLRHLALSADGETVAFGMQDQDRSRVRPLMGVLRPGKGLELLPMPEDGGTLRAYIGSVVIDASGRYLASTSPKGGLVGLWRLSDGRALAGFSLADVCGLAAGEEPGTFWATSGYGDVVRLAAHDDGLKPQTHWRADAAFDNHLLRI